MPSENVMELRWLDKNNWARYAFQGVLTANPGQASVHNRISNLDICKEMNMGVAGTLMSGKYVSCPL